MLTVVSDSDMLLSVITLTITVGSDYACGRWSVCRLSQVKLAAMAQGLFVT